MDAQQGILRIVVFFISCLRVSAYDSFGALCEDRLAVERVYHSHRLGTQLAFDPSNARSQVERVVQDHLQREWVLRTVFGVSITPEMTSNEIHRIDSTTRAPGMLAEIKAALGGDVDRFGRCIVQPILVERVLRERFDQQTSLQDSQRKHASKIRDQLRAARSRGATVEQLLQSLTETTNVSTHTATWSFTSSRDTLLQEEQWSEYSIRGAVILKGIETNAPGNAPASIAGESSSPAGNDRSSDPGSYLHGRGEMASEFNELPVELRNVLDTQIRGPGDISAVVEFGNLFRVFVGLRRDQLSLSVVVLTVRKRDFEEWVREVAGRAPASAITYPKQGRS